MSAEETGMLHSIPCDFEFEDERGKLIQLIRDGYRQVNVIFSKKSVVRGGHYHKHNSEAFYIISGALTIDVDGAKHRFAEGDFFGIDPFDVHSFFFEEDTVLVSMYSEGVEEPDGTKDIFVG